MNYRSLGRTGVMVSELCLGCMNFGGPTSEAESFDMIDHAIEAGINFFDTANVYSRGGSESIVGKALQRNGKRERIVLATKVHGRMDDDDILAAGNNRRHIIQQCEASLKRLQTDYIDLYQLHRPNPDIPIDETLRALDDLITAGKVRYIGSSSFPSWRVMESLWAAKELGLNRIISEQPPYHLLDRSIEREMIPMAQSYGIAIIPWSPLASGFLSGKYQRDEPAPADSRFGRGAAVQRWRDRHFTDLGFDVLDAVQEIAAEKGKSSSQIALAWVNSKPGITAPIIGPRTMAHLDDNLGALEVELSADDHAQLDAIAEPERASVPYYHGGSINFKPNDHAWL